jgi:hypothetical protein
VKRRTVVIDRLSCAAAGAALVALGLAAAAWRHGDLHIPPGSSVTVPALHTITRAGWWPFALGAAAIILIAVGLLWLFGRRPGQTLGSSALPGSSADGVLTADLDSAVAAAAATLAQHPQITTASGKSTIDRGQHVLELDLKIESTAGALAAVTPALDAARHDLAAALDGIAFSSRILLRTSRRSSAPSRVT